ncbi:MAG: DUF6325 family protein [Nocardioides sp.]|uniref:DUF6325 family protein n=1 Tax=Nocardioides sp. TaxID=35761 RepID=UPI003F111E41
MTDKTVDPELDEMGPVDYMVIEFDQDRVTGEAFGHLVGLVDGGIVRILDLAFLARDEQGTLTAVELRDVDGDGVLDLTVFEGVSSGLLDADDLNDAASVIEAGKSACVIVYENLWAAPLATALRRGGAQLVASGRVPVQALLAAAEAAAG